MTYFCNLIDQRDECCDQIPNSLPRFPLFIAMETAFYILLYIRTPRGFESFARFFIGNRDDLARQLFDQLKCTESDIEDCILQMDLMETKNNLPVNLKVIGCTLEQMAENCKIITKEAFKIFTLKS